jgi:hypothetical protein
MGFRLLGYKYAKSIECSQYRNISSWLRRIVELHKDGNIYLEAPEQPIARNVVNPFNINLQTLMRWNYCPQFYVVLFNFHLNLMYFN